jgi:tRNA A37 methylthiotransferase MiaB
MKRLYVSTNGCEEAGLSSKYVEHFLDRHGWELTQDVVAADFVVFFACGLTEEKAQQSRAMASRLQEGLRNGSRLIIWGCLPKIDPDALADLRQETIIGPRDGAFFEGLVEAPVVSFSEITANELARAERLGFYDALPARRVLVMKLWRFLLDAWNRRMLGKKGSEDPIFYVRVASGCTSFCTFCSERVAWGDNTSRPEEAILEEVRCGLGQGYRRFLLVAGDLGAYGIDNGSSLPGLLRRIVELDGNRSLRLILPQLNPRYLKKLLPALEEIFASGKVEMLGCPVQSGSDRILRRMGRRYSAAEWRHFMLRMSKRFPDVHLRPQFMVGFPGETEEDFRATLRLLDPPLFLHDIKIFQFAPRPSVAAARLEGQVAESVKRSRYRRLSRRYAYLHARHRLAGVFRPSRAR